MIGKEDEMKVEDVRGKENEMKIDDVRGKWDKRR